MKYDDDYIKRLKAEHEIYADLAGALTSTLDLSEVLTIIMNKIRDLLKPRNWSLLLMDAEGDQLTFEIAVGEGAEVLKGTRLKLGEGVAGWVAQSGKSVFIEDVRLDPRFCSRCDQLSRFTTKSIICVPLTNRGKVLGVIELINRIEEEAFSDLDRRSLETIAEYAAIAIQNAASFRKIKLLSLTDDHTSLYNMRYLYEAIDRELASAARESRELSMIFLDLDHFKQVNDVHGHLCGSKVLQEVGLLIKRLTRPGDIAVRYGGDEFVILLPGSSKEDAFEFAAYLREQLNQHVFLAEEGLKVYLTASFGVASYPRDAHDKGELLSIVDATMYQVKDTTRDAIAMAGTV
jgi:diguanylate cyclase (GGDEF)-like protein